MASIPKPRTPFKATKLWNQLLNSFKEGMELKRKRYRLKSYQRCFSGSDALEWLHKYLQNHPSFGDHVTKEQAFTLLQKFLDNNVFESAVGKNNKTFQDTNYLYKFIGDKEETSNKENSITTQKSLTNLLKNIGKRHSSIEINIEDGIDSKCSSQEEVNNNITTNSKSQHTTNKNNTTAFLSLLDNIKNIDVSSKEKVNKTCLGVTNMLFDPADEEDDDDIFNSSISQSFSRSYSLRAKKYASSTTSDCADSIWPKQGSDSFNINTHSNKGSEKRNLLKKKPSNPGNTIATGNVNKHNILGKRSSSTRASVLTSPNKKSRSTRNSFVNKSIDPLEGECLTGRLPRKAINVLGEKPSLINKCSSVHANVVLNLNETDSDSTNSVSKMLKNSKPFGQTESVKGSRKSTGAAKSNKQFSRKKLGFESTRDLHLGTKQTNKSTKDSKTHDTESANGELKTTTTTSASCTTASNSSLSKSKSFALHHQPNSYTPRVYSPHPMRRRSFSQHNLLTSKCQSVYDISERVPSTASSNNSHEKKQSGILNLQSSRMSSIKCLYKAASSWTLDRIGLSHEYSESSNSGSGGSSKRNEKKSTPEITPNELYETWKSVALLSVRKMLNVERIADYVDCDSVYGCNIMRNMECSTIELTNGAPDWLISAMQCLEEWPNHVIDKQSSGQDLPDYPGFERDVYRAIKEHYHNTLKEPLVPCHLYPVLEECVDLLQSDDVDMAVRLLQHTQLLLPCWSRRQLQLLIRFMKRIASNSALEISRDMPNTDLVVHSFFRIVARKEKHTLITPYNEGISIRITNCLMDYYNDIFTAPQGLRVKVDHKLAVIHGTLPFRSDLPSGDTDPNRPCSADSFQRSKPRVFCQQITKEQYEREAVDFSRNAITDLLQSILDDKTLNAKERTKRLKQFEKAYPDIYAEKVSGISENNGGDESTCSTDSQYRSSRFKMARKPSFLPDKLL